jgi:protein-S-isoprenylcysteine O-methyltransferase Ste14
VRHPGYLGKLLSLLAFPLVLEAYWAFLPTALAAAILWTRTVREDRFLQERLPGYADYARRVRWRLVPGLT